MPRLSTSALADLRARNPVADVVARLGGSLRRSGRTLVGPCPICGGGKASARFEVKDETQWVCAVCEAGSDVIGLVGRVLGLDFRDAVDWLGGAAAEEDLATVSTRQAAQAAARAARAAEAERYREAERRRLGRRWDALKRQPRDSLCRYIESRGLACLPHFARFDPAAPYAHGTVVDGDGRGGPRLVHVGPAMVLPILRPDGSFGGLHVTWLAPDGAGKATIADPNTGEILPAKKCRGSKKAGRIEVVRVPDARRLVLGEGVETVGAAAEAEAEAAAGVAAGTAYWSAVDLGNLGGPAFQSVPHPTARHANGQPRRVPGPQPDWGAPALPIPDSVDELVLLGDGDSDPVLTANALERAASRYARPGRSIRIAWAPPGQDFNDLCRDPVEAASRILEPA